MNTPLIHDIIEGLGRYTYLTNSQLRSLTGRNNAQYLNRVLRKGTEDKLLGVIKYPEAPRLESMYYLDKQGYQLAQSEIFSKNPERL
jgi:hypothetical protein